jgi:hypothetical protein
MTFDDKEVLGRFHRALVRQIYARDPSQIESPFTVAEIYQNLVPYRTHRDEIGVEMNADYEHALLRLLAGEGDYLSIESKTARQEIQEELDSPNPNTGKYRDFAAADVRLNPDKVGEDMLENVTPVEDTTGPFDEDVMEVDAVGEEEVTGDFEEFIESQDGAFERLEVEPLGANLGPIGDVEDEKELDSEDIPVEVSGELDHIEVEEEMPMVGEVTEEKEDLPPFENCPWCRESLPQQARVRFCPFCGSNVRLRPCPECGEELQLNWRFCIACGTEVES